MDMAETISIPSSSLFLEPPPVQKAARRPQQSSGKAASKTADSTGDTKRKQTKSRNGCKTCKAKRFKCDETQPTCQNCARRSVPCGGYEKDWKWRSFEEPCFTGKPASKLKKGVPPTSVPIHFGVNSPPPAGEFYQHTVRHAPPPSGFFPGPPSPVTMQSLPATAPFIDSTYTTPTDMYAMSQESPFTQPSPFTHVLPPISPISPIEPFTPGTVESPNGIFEAESTMCTDTCSRKTSTSSISSGQSPRLVDLLLPGSVLSIPPQEYTLFRSQHPDSFGQPWASTPPADADILGEDDIDVEEIPRNFDSPWLSLFSSQTPSTSSPNPSHPSYSTHDSSRFPLLTQPTSSWNSPEVLTRLFDRDTCGILSVKDGPTENPWRTLVWPLARDCPALYHAIASLTSFHHSKDSHPIRVQGIDHLHTSLHALASRLALMRVDAAISTTLVLAFSESWDQHIKTGVNHIKGAKVLIDKALVQHRQCPIKGEELSRLQFLCGTWMYMDVIARLTSADEDESDDFDLVSDIYMNGQRGGQLDPLMGCAGTLFPIIGRVANLVRKVRKSDSNSPSIISQAMELKKKLEDWDPPSYIENPEDETTTPHDSMKTAVAYQYATLLYLHQAVPEIPSLPSADLAKRALCELAMVRPQSRSVIVHIYPLMAAGCEAATQEDRQWVQRRWLMMSARMKLGIIDKCLEVTKEVWSRRDAYAEQGPASMHSQDNVLLPTSSLKRNFSSITEDVEPDGSFCWLDVRNHHKRRAVNGIGTDTSLFDTPQPMLSSNIKREGSEGKRSQPDVGTEALPYDLTVKGRLHWLGVMKDWNWEVLLG